METKESISRLQMITANQQLKHVHSNEVQDMFTAIVRDLEKIQPENAVIPALDEKLIRTLLTSVIHQTDLKNYQKMETFVTPVEHATLNPNNVHRQKCRIHRIHRNVNG